MKRFAVLLLALAMTVCCAMPAFAAGTIEVTEDVSVSDDYDTETSSEIGRAHV